MNTNHFLKRAFCFTIMVFSIALCQAQVPGLKTVPGRHGIWVVCGDQLPKNFTYHIQRQKIKEHWLDVANITFPSSADDIQANLLNTERTAGIDIIAADRTMLNNLWQRINTDVVKNSPAEIEDNLPLRSATGTAWYDGNADSATVYQYKVQLVSDGKVLSESTVKSDTYPARRFNTIIKPILIKPLRTGIYGEFEIVDKGMMSTCKILRSYYLRSGYELIDAMPIFSRRNGKLICLFTDNTAAEKVPYTYVLLPLDAVGNPGQFSPELRAFAVPDKTIVPSVHHFDAASNEEKKAIKLSWRLQNPINITSIDIFRSKVRDGIYNKIASVSQHDTLYYDHDVQPIVTYWYTIRLNGVYETSPASPRVPGILRAVNKNLFPPQNLTLKQNGNKVTLRWQRVEDDTRAYIVYRAMGKSGNLQQIGPVIVTDSATVTYTDTIPVSANPATYTYAVADENTSYAISPKSSLVFANIAGNSPQPIPYNVTVNKLSDHKLMVIWPDMSKQSNNIRGYLLYRRIQKPGNKTEDTLLISKKMIPFMINHFIDSTITSGASYYYSLRTVGLDGTTFSSASLETGFTINEDMPGSVGNIKVFSSGNTVELRWNNPVGQVTQAINIYRSARGGESKLLATLTADKEAYSDKDVAHGNIYYYTFELQDNKGKASNMTEPVGIHLQ